MSIYFFWKSYANFIDLYVYTKILGLQIPNSSLVRNEAYISTSLILKTNTCPSSYIWNKIFFVLVDII